MPVFSVVIPLYNKEKYIAQTLENVLKQRFTDFEIIVVNDGSTDASGKIVKSFSDARISYFSTANHGAAAARNFGIEKSTAPYIAFLDADDLWMQNHLEELKKLIDRFPQAGMYCNRYQLIFENGSTYQPSFYGIDDTYEGVVEDYFAASLHYAVASSISVAVPKSIFSEIGNFKKYISSGQDTDMWIRIALHSKIIIGNKLTSSYLHYIEGSLSKTDILQKNIKRFDEYQDHEKSNLSLKKYLDLYRMEYAMQYKMAGASNESKSLYNQISKENLSVKSKALYILPKGILLLLLKIKQLLRRNGIDFSIYN
ncbi:glycosyltransferase family 2 protein [Flavobacterium ardleyense]|uniref:glycosyltransferase family 2 protein n=1 Tax=Flavobacterium ardleyense TaxID=2038737 RepID=UPI00298CB03F|nr:glycosyltransferase family A protein [Flavobacterium ardleyense]